MTQVIIQQLLNGLIAGSIYVLVGLGLTILFGVLGVLNFAHGAVTIFGAYVTLSIMTRTGAPFLLAMVGAAIVAGLIGVVLEGLLFKRTRQAPINGLILSLGLISVFETALLAAYTASAQSIPPQFTGVISIGRVTLAEQRLFVLLATVVLLLALNLTLERTRLGRAVRAAAQQPLAAQLMGVDVDRIHLLIFAVACILASVAGGLYATLFSFTPLTGSDIILKAFVVVIIGGMGSLPGAVVGGILLGIAESLGAQFVPSEFHDALFFGIIVLVLMFRPRGLFGVQERAA